MINAVTIKEIRQITNEWKKEGLSIGFVPTMGYLHEGHKSLIDRSVAENDRTVVSIFVNPMQFGPAEDLAVYPRDAARDASLCEASGTDLIFMPSAEEIYPAGFCSYADMAGPARGLCGQTRPGLFRGVCTVVNKLFNIVCPARAYFGEKDAQQLAVIKRMVLDLNMDIEIIGCSTIREKDGLAKSSRNDYMDSEERNASAVLYRSLLMGRKMIEDGEVNAQIVDDVIRDIICAEPLAAIDYIEIVDADTIEKVEKITGHVLIALAVYIGKTRLIDNILIK